MGRAAKVLCAHCDARMPVGLAFCPRCAHPTTWASHEQRIAWELEQWRAVRPTARDIVPRAPRAPVHRVSMPARRPEPPRVVELSPVVEPPRVVEAPRVPEAPRIEPAPAPPAAPPQPERVVVLLEDLTARVRDLNTRVALLDTHVRALSRKPRVFRLLGL